MTDIYVRKFRPPPRVSIGDDGIPNYVVAQRGEAHYWPPPEGMQLLVWCDNTPIAGVVEADRKRGWVRGAHYIDLADGSKQLVRDDDGTRLYRMYYGKVRFLLIPLHPTRAREPVAPNVHSTLAGVHRIGLDGQDPHKIARAIRDRLTH